MFFPSPLVMTLGPKTILFFDIFNFTFYLFYAVFQLYLFYCWTDIPISKDINIFKFPWGTHPKEIIKVKSKSINVSFLLMLTFEIANLASACFLKKNVPIFPNVSCSSQWKGDAKVEPSVRDAAASGQKLSLTFIKSKITLAQLCMRRRSQQVTVWKKSL